MSLSRFLQDKEVKAKFEQEFPVIRGLLKKDKQVLLAPVLTINPETLLFWDTKRSQIIGTAFDYLMRFYIKYLNPHAITQSWIADDGTQRIYYTTKFYYETHNKDNTILYVKEPQYILNELTEKEYIDVEVQITKGLELLEHSKSDLLQRGYNHYKLAIDTIRKAKKHYSDFLQTGIFTDDLIKSSLFLASLDGISRSGSYDLLAYEGIVYNIDTDIDTMVEELRNLTNSIPQEKFLNAKICLLNPDFGFASKLLGGADADIILDDIIIDIKTVKNIGFQRSYLNQLIGYYILAKINGYEINKIGIYYSRYGYLFTMNINDIINPATFPAFKDWFCLKISKCEYNYEQLAQCKDDEWEIYMAKMIRAKEEAKARKKVEYQQSGNRPLSENQKNAILAIMSKRKLQLPATFEQMTSSEANSWITKNQYSPLHIDDKKSN